MAKEVKKKAVDWFDAGGTVYKERLSGPDLFPPLGDMEAQREWLGGFGAAWASNLDDRGSVGDALTQALKGKREL